MYVTGSRFVSWMSHMTGVLQEYCEWDLLWGQGGDVLTHAIITVTVSEAHLTKQMCMTWDWFTLEIDSGKLCICWEFVDFLEEHCSGVFKSFAEDLSHFNWKEKLSKCIIFIKGCFGKFTFTWYCKKKTTYQIMQSLPKIYQKLSSFAQLTLLVLDNLKNRLLSGLN